MLLVESPDDSKNGFPTSNTQAAFCIDRIRPPCTVPIPPKLTGRHPHFPSVVINWQDVNIEHENPE